MLGVPKTRLVLNAESAFVANGVVFDTDTLPFTTDKSTHPITQKTVDALDALDVEKSVSISTKTIIVGSVLNISTLAMEVSAQRRRE